MRALVLLALVACSSVDAGPPMPRPAFAPSSHVVVAKMLDVAEVGPGDVVYDLGSGDGRIVIAAARRGARAVGVEADPLLVADSQAAAVPGATFVHGDMFRADLSTVSVVALFVGDEAMAALEPQLAKLKPGARIVSHHFLRPGREPDETTSVSEYDPRHGAVRTYYVHLWRVE
jgi:SAM-dependent methyltransferase